MTVPTDQLTLRFARSMAEADKDRWDVLAEPLDTPFFEYAWLKLLEDSGSAAPETTQEWYRPVRNRLGRPSKTPSVWSTTMLSRSLP